MTLIRSFGTCSFLLLGYFIFSGNTCFKTGSEPEEEKCGLSGTWDKSFNAFAFRDRGVTSGIREFIYEDVSTPVDICTEEHVDVIYYASLKDGISGPPAGLSVTGRAYWSLFGRSTPLPWNGRMYTASENIGLKQAYPDGEGSISLQLIIRFPTQGSALEDGAYVESLFKELLITLYYRHTKL